VPASVVGLLAGVTGASAARWFLAVVVAIVRVVDRRFVPESAVMRQQPRSALLWRRNATPAEGASSLHLAYDRLLKVSKTELDQRQAETANM
jgi:hypothetical protein